MTEKQKIQNVPTNIITGFLGVGKTSAILQLLKSKPANENWAVLVNEFGEIGIDGALFSGEHQEKQGVYISEVPGGCMCCAAGLPMQVALALLLDQAKPDRLLIEPTGLGHPKEVLQTLTAEHYQGVLAIQKIITLVDARKLNDDRYTNNETFNQQINIADIIVGNKQDLYTETDKKNLQDYIQKVGAEYSQVVFTANAKLDNEILEGKTKHKILHTHQHHHFHETVDLNSQTLPDCGYVKAENYGEGFESVGWRFAQSKTFNHDKLYSFLNGIVAERVKAVFNTEQGSYAYNMVDNTLTEYNLKNSLESRIEIISEKNRKDWDSDLLNCLV